MTKPSSTPTTMAMPKPTMVTQKVRQAWPAITSLNSQNCVQIRHGLGKRNSDTLNAEHSTCHNTSTAVSSSHGDQISICFLFIAKALSGDLFIEALLHQLGAWHQCGRATRARCR